MEADVVKEVLHSIGLTTGLRGDFKISNGNVQFNCPFHGDTKPSAGISIEKGVGSCFACLETFNLPKLVAHCMGWYSSGSKGNNYNYHKAIEFLEDFGYSDANLPELYEARKLYKTDLDQEDFDMEEEHKRSVMPMSYIAPYKCGKETHQLYFDRGYDEEDVELFRVGWDRTLKRIVFPAFHEDEKLCGVVGRAVLESTDPKYSKIYTGLNSPKYFIYDNAPISEYLYPEWLFEPKEFIDSRGRKRKRAILVEGYMDAQRMHKYGFHETLSTTNSKIGYDKKEKYSHHREFLIRHGVTDVILMKDADKAGQKGIQFDHNILKDYMTTWTVDYPKGVKDPDSLTKRQVMWMLFNKRPVTQSVKRLK